MSNNKNKKTQIIYIISLILSLFVAFFLYLDYCHLKVLNEEKETLIQTQKKQLKEKEEEINLCFEDRGKNIGYTQNQPYSFQSFGIFSPLFINKKVSTTKYSYKRNFITQKFLYISTEDKEVIHIEVWHFYGKEQKIFSGYENYQTRPTSLLEIEKNYQGEYKNKRGILMKKAYQSVPGPGHFAYHLEFFTKNSPSGEPIFVRLSIYKAQTDDDNRYHFFNETPPQLIIGQNKIKQLQDFADTIDIKQY